MPTPKLIFSHLHARAPQTKTTAATAITMTDHPYCEGLKMGYNLKKEVKKTSVKFLAVQDSLRESGKYEENQSTMVDWKCHLSKICLLISSVACKSDEASCKKRAERILTLLILLRKEMDLYSECNSE